MGFLGPVSQISLDSFVPSVKDRRGAVARHKLEAHGLVRRYSVYTPTYVKAGEPAPMMFALHGLGCFPWFLNAITDLNLFAERHSFRVCYPAAISTAWRIENFIQGPIVSPAHDLEFMRALMPELQKNYPTSDGKLHGFGHSNGAFFLLHVAQKLPGTFSTLCAVSGGIPLSHLRDFAFAEPTPTLLMHGTADRTVDFGGRSAWIGPSHTSAEVTLLQVLKANGCELKPWQEQVLDHDTRDKRHATIRDYRGDAPVRSIEMIGSGHTWPSTKVRGKSTYSGFCGEFDGAEEIFRFIKNG